MSEHMTVFKNQIISFGIYRNCLTDLFSETCRILKCDVVCIKMICLHKKSIRTECSAFTSVLHWHKCIIIIGNHRAVCIFTDECNIVFMNLYPFFINTILNKNRFRYGSNAVDGLLNRSIVTGAVFCHCNHCLSPLLSCFSSCLI